MEGGVVRVAGREPLVAPRLYAIADAEALAPRTLADGAAAMIEAGIEWVQLRAKRLSAAAFDDEIARLLERGLGGAHVWIDDRVDLAALRPVSGVHLGQSDLPPAAARAVLGGSRWIGLSTHDEAQLRGADLDPDVEVVALGPIFPTRSKQRPEPVVGLGGLRRLRALTGKPLVAIGGIDASNLGAVLDAGADTVAVIGAACRGGDVARSCAALLAAARAR